MDEERNMITVALEDFLEHHEKSVLYNAIVDGLMGCARLDPASDEDLVWDLNDLQALLKAVCPYSYNYKAQKLKERKEAILKKMQEAQE